MKKKEVLGIDVSKEKFDACIYGNKKQCVFVNKKSGFKKLKTWAEKFSAGLDELLICFEHTGMYAVPLQLFCEENNLSYVQVSGLQVKRSLGIQRGKNDQIDSFRLAEYAFLHQEKLKLSKLEEKPLIRLKYLLSFRARLVRQRAGYKATINEYKNFLSLDSKDEMIKIHKQLIKVTSKHIEVIENQIKQLINKNEKIKKQYELATSVKGIGPITAAYMIVYTNCFKDFKKWRQFACYVGSAPFEYSSGTSVHGKTRISHYAQKTIKAILTNAAKAAIRHNMEIRQYYEKRIQEGKHKKIVVNNVRNKLISRVFAVVNRGTPYVDLTKYAT